MYAFFTKGMTVGHILTRLVLREITSIPGVILDFIFAIFWMPDYTSYWAEQSQAIYYADNTRHTGVMRGLFGWVGEILGFVIGGTSGAIIGTALFLPDLLYRGFVYLAQTIHNSLNDFAVFIGQTSFFARLAVASEPHNYMSKSWNLGVATLGMLLSAIPYVATKAVGFFIPFLDLSYPVAYLFSAAGGLLGWALGAVLYPPIYLLEKLIDLAEQFRTTVTKAVALVYAKSGEEPTGSGDEECIPFAAIHSAAFCDQVTHYRRTTWAALIFGPLKKQEQQLEESADDQNILRDAITMEPLGANGARTVIDPHGHSFNDDSEGKNQGIYFWVRNHHNCPINRQPLATKDLVPNRALDDLLAQQTLRP